MQAIFKYIFDLILATFFLVLLSPLIFIVACLVKLKLGSPIVFKQPRVGLNEKIFSVYKFRTMTNQKDHQGNLLSDTERLTVFGKWMRSYSLDELPQLLNVLRGEMSFVGPRPLLVEYLPLYSAEQRKRHTVRPGITGLAQVSGRNALTWQEKFQLDLQYIRHPSFLMDMKILGLTFQKVFGRAGITSVGQATMEKFSGNH